VRESPSPFRPCLERPGHEVLLEARRLRARTLWQCTAAAISRLLHWTIAAVGKSHVAKSGERGAR